MQKFFLAVLVSIIAAFFSPPSVSAHTYPDGTLIRLEGDFKIYTIFKNKRRWIKNIEVFKSYGYKWEDILIIPPIYIEDMPMNNLVRQEGDTRVYAINDAGYKRHIANPEVFNSYGFKWEDIATITKEEVDNYGESYLIREANDPKVYYLENGKKRWIDSIESFYIHGLDWSAIHVINKTDTDSYYNGETVTPASTIQPPSGTIPAVPAVPALPKDKKPAVPAIPAQPATSTPPSIPSATSTIPAVPPSATSTTPVVPPPAATSTEPGSTAPPPATPTPAPTPAPTPTPTPTPTPSATSTPPSATSTTPSADTTPPVISDVQATYITETSTIISWKTDELADSQIEYGTTISYGSATWLDPILTISAHGDGLSNLLSGTTYHFRVKSKDSSGNLAISGDYTFNTTAPATSGVSSISGGYFHTCALLADKTVKCWGFNYYGQLGNGINTNSNVPVLVSNLTNVTAIILGFHHTCALLTDSTVKCWGFNYYGQLGNGTKIDSNVPVLVSNLTNVTAIASNSHHTCALLADKTVRCWGKNSSGQLGNGTKIDSNVPVLVSNLTNVTAITLGRDHTCALLADSTVKCWGTNFSGQLGNGTETSSNVPVAVSNLTNVTAIASNYHHTCALLADKTVRCWGHNVYGQLGNGTKIDSNVPVLVSNLTNVTAIAAGPASHTCALLADKTVRCWGENSYGQLGNGTNINSNVPVVVSL